MMPFRVVYHNKEIIMNDKLYQTMHEEDPFLSTEEEDLSGSAEEQDLFLPAQEPDLHSKANEAQKQDLFLPQDEPDGLSPDQEQEFAPAPKSRPSVPADRPSHPPSGKSQPSPLPHVKGRLSPKTLVGAGVAGVLWAAPLVRGVVGWVAFGSVGWVRVAAIEVPLSVG